MNYFQRHKALSITLAVIIIFLVLAYIAGVRIHFFMEPGVPGEALTAQAAGASGCTGDPDLCRQVANSGSQQWNNGTTGFTFTAPTLFGGRIGGGPATYGLSITWGNANTPAQGNGGVAGGRTGNGGTVIIIKKK